MNPDEFAKRTKKLISREIADSRAILHWFYLSYADDDGFRGGAYVLGYGPVSACVGAAQCGISPGGEVRIFPIPKDCEDRLPPEQFRRRLLSLEELKSIEPMVRLSDGKDV